MVLLATMAGPSFAAPDDQGQPGGTPPQRETLIGVLPAPPMGSEIDNLPALPPVPDRFLEPMGPFAMSMEVLASAAPSQFGLIASPGCVTDSVYKRGMKMVFRFEVYDLDNKVRVTPADGSTAQVTLPDGTSLNAVFLPRGAPDSDLSAAPWTWVTTWHVPTDYPLGPVMYHVDVATPDGRSLAIHPTSIPGQPVIQGAPFLIGGTYPTIIP